MSPQGRTWQLFEIPIVVADEFEQLSVCDQTEFLCHHPGPGVRLRIVNRDLHFKRTNSPASVPLGDVKCFRRWVARLIEPCLAVETLGVDNQRIALPPANGMTQPGRIEIGAEFPTVQKHLPPQVEC